MNADGSGQRRLTQFGLHPLWSPDGRMIAFRSSGAGNDDDLRHERRRQWAAEPDADAEGG